MKDSKIYSIVKFKCPRCHEGQFLVSHPYDLKRVGDVREKCDVCDLNFAPEPGFYYGAMYVSYALGVALFVTIWASCNWFFDNVSVWTQIGLVVFFSIILGPYLFALSKIIWANFFIHFDKNYVKHRG
jgi:uncharacterized protein (DUF983 family)